MSSYILGFCVPSGSRRQTRTRRTSWLPSRFSFNGYGRSASKTLTAIGNGWSSLCSVEPRSEPSHFNPLECNRSMTGVLRKRLGSLATSRTKGRPGAIGTTQACFLAALMLLPTQPGPAQTPALSSHQQLARDLFAELIELNTSNPFGSTKAAQAMATRLNVAGFLASEVLVLGPRPDRHNLVARLRGTGKAKPVLFLAHLDVVEARKEDWSAELDPFKLTERSGYFYGRGTADIKDEAAGLIAGLIRLKQEGFRPSRDIIVALTADEEGGDANGVEWLLEHRRELIDAVYCINTDAGGGQIEKEKRLRYNVQTSEKASVTFRLEV